MNFISVVIPTYNRAHLIAETLNAILQQTVPPDEIIVVDDGSTDGTEAVVRGFGNRVSLIQKENAGDLVARNVGLRAARGNLVAFCDSDDLWEDMFLADMTALFVDVPTLFVAYANFRILQDGKLSSRTKFDDAPENFWDGEHLLAEQRGVFPSSAVRRLLDFQPFFPSAMMVRRDEFLAHGGWDETFSKKVGSDIVTVLRVAASPPIGVCHRPLVRIRKHGANMSADSEAMNLGDALAVEHVLTALPAAAALADAFRTSISRRRTAALNAAFSRRDFKAVRDLDSIIPRQGATMVRRVKAAIARLPQPIARLLADVLSR